jgi:hypothetical protein
MQLPVSQVVCTVELILVCPRAQVKIDRTIVIEETGSGQCRYRITGSVKVKMFGIGHLVEKQVMANSVDSLSMLAEVVQRCAAAASGERLGF